VDQSLRFGSYVEFQCPPGHDHADLIWDVVALGEQADRLGFEVFTCLEHDFFEQFAIMPAPLPLFATLAQRTRNLTFRAMCHTLPLHNPFVLAGELATADILLDGRFEIGVGRGHAWLQKPANIVLEENIERYKECLDILELAWTNDRFDYDGKHYRADQLSVVPKPLQRPHPRIFQVGTSAKWFQRAADNGYGVVLGGPAPTAVFREPAKLYRQLCAQAGTAPYLGWIKPIYLDEDEDTALEEAREATLDYIKFNVSPMHTLARHTPAEKQRLIDAGYGFYAADDFPNMEKLTFEQLVEHGIVLVGTPDRVGDQLLELWDEFQFEELLVVSHFGGTERWQSMKTQALFARDIMPRMTEAVADRRVSPAVAS
jgi:alkanesulfonate monooxygenase SsuD/methylene tetrahydromethanopterin reductase-like flavin-dependent oxidoreductase (luciferase family)